MLGDEGLGFGGGVGSGVGAASPFPARRAHERKGGLLLGTDREQRFLTRVGFRAVKRNGQRREAAGAADELDGLLAAGLHRAQHRIVIAREDFAVVAQDDVGDCAEGGAGLRVVGHDGFVMHVSRGHYQHRQCVRTPLGAKGLGEIAQQQMLHRGARQHDAELGQLVGQAGREVRLGALAQKHDGALHRFELLLLNLIHPADAPRVVGRGHHDGERLALAALALAQLGERLGVFRVAHQMEATKSLNRHDAAAHKRAHRRGEDGVGRFTRVTPGN